MVLNAGMGTDERSAWSEERRRAAAVRADARRHRVAVETEQARRLITEFVAQARARRLPASPLTALAYNGRTRYRTRLRGWYLQADRAVAVGEDGGFYLLTVPPSFTARLTGVDVEPRDPPLIVNEGGRDGESMPLHAMLRKRLDAGPDWP